MDKHPWDADDWTAYIVVVIVLVFGLIAVSGW
jgi:hypothetical protein